MKKKQCVYNPIIHDDYELRNVLLIPKDTKEAYHVYKNYRQ